MIFYCIFKEFPRKNNIPDKNCPKYVLIAEYYFDEFVEFSKKINFEKNLGLSDKYLINICELVIDMMAFKPIDRPDTD